MRIGVFDSGIGGLTILKKIIQKYPQHKYFYYGDTANLPYGEKTEEQLFKFSDNIIKFLISKKVDIIIIACGTISSTIYERIKNKYKVPLIDVISPAIDYLNNNNLGNIGIIGTKMTIGSKIFEKNVNKPLLLAACPKFVPLIESNNIKTLEFNDAINAYLSRMLGKIDSLVLGCTHYPLVTAEISKYFNNKINIVDLGDIIVKNIKIQNEEEYDLELIFSKVSYELKTNISNILGNNISYRITRKELNSE